MRRRSWGIAIYDRASLIAARNPERERRHVGRSPLLPPVWMLALVLGAHVTVVGPAYAQAPDSGEIRSAVHFALQCNATIGTIEEVTLTAVVSTRADLFAVRGMYRQKIGGVAIFGMRSPDAAGGVFEGIYESGAKKLQALEFKISLRTGAVAPTCLR